MLLRLQNDLLEVLDACASKTLDKLPPLQFSNHIALSVVMAANGYPASYAKGTAIKGLEAADNLQGVKVFHAGTAKNADGQIVANGGRVLNVTASAPTVTQAQKLAYDAVDKIEWDGGFCRRDIGWRAVKAEKAKAA